MKYLQFNNRNSQEFGLGILSVDIGTPKPNLITEKVPYSNGSYDFSTIVTGGLMTYGDRSISVDFNYNSKDKSDMYKIFSQVSSWLLSGEKSKISFNYIDGTYTGRCTQISDLKAFITLGKFTAKFTCNPFLDCGEYNEYIWDTFSFIDGVSGSNIYKVNSGGTIEIQIDGVDVNPTINVDKEISININNKSYNLNIGNNKIFGLIFKNGNNKIKIIKADNASVSFDFKKEMI